jgi:hypothetical protein
VYTRAFAQGEGMLIPLADHLNHEDVCVDYITLSLEFLQTKSITGALLNDYKDFTGVSQNSNSLMKTRTHKNRLEKYLTWFDDEKICDMSAIWEIDQILTIQLTSILSCGQRTREVSKLASRFSTVMED